MSSLYKAIVFDFGGVLIDWDPRRLYRKYFDGDHAAMEDFLEEIGFTEWNLEQDKGRPFDVAVAELSKQFPHHERLIKAYDDQWDESILGPIQPTVDLLYKLKESGRPLYGLSNWSEEKFQLTRPNYAFFDCFDEIVVSGEVKLLKPDPRIYEVFLERINRSADECVFIDDSAANIAAADELGFKAIHFESTEHLERDLRLLDLL